MKKILLTISFSITTLFVFIMKVQAKTLSLNKMPFILGDSDTGDLKCENVSQIYVVGQMLFNYIKIIVPILLILFVIFDLVKAMVSGTADDMKKAQKSAFTRSLAALIVFFLPSIINLILKIAGIESSTCGVD